MRNAFLIGAGILAVLVATPVLARSVEAASPASTQNEILTQDNDALRHDLQVAKAKVYPALVNISVVFRYFQDGRAQHSPAGGSGVIVSPDGYVITNFHVAGNTTHIVCTLTTGEAIEADDVADDSLSDISILRLRLKDRTRHTPLHYAELGDSDKLQVGDFVLAMGNPLMLSSSMTLGIASNTKRVFTDFLGNEMNEMSLEHGERTGIFTRWIQHDALILPGNSGGPLVNLQGQVIGINELGGDGQGFAIPSNIAAYVYHQIRAHGRVIRGTLGVSIYPVSKLGRSSGALVSAVTPGFPGAKAGIQPGDIILAIDGDPTNVNFFEEVPVLYQQIARMPIGHKARIRLVRAGKPMTLVATIGELPKYEGLEQEFLTAGASVQDLTPVAALEDYLPDTEGVVVTGVRAGSPFDAAEPRIEPGDIIRGVEGRKVDDIDTFRKALNTVRGKQYAVQFLRRDESLITIVKPEDEKPPEGGDLPQAWLGVKTQVMIPEIAKALGVDGTTGFRITEVYPWTEASKAGLRTGDIITAVGATKLDASSPQDAEDLKHTIEDLDVGSQAKLSILRNGKPQIVSVKLEPSPTDAGDAKSAKQKEFEFGVREITLTDRAENHWSKDQIGLLVTDVTGGGWAHIGGLHPDDLIVSIDDKPVPTVDAFNDIMATIMKTHPKDIRIFVRRDYLTQFVFIEPDWSKLLDSE